MFLDVDVFVKLEIYWISTRTKVQELPIVHARDGVGCTTGIAPCTQSRTGGLHKLFIPGYHKSLILVSAVPTGVQ